MPALLGDARIKEKFQDQEYLDTVEHMFREKFIENLSVSHKAFRPVHYGNTGYGDSSPEIKILKGFSLRIDWLKRNYIIF